MARRNCRIRVEQFEKLVSVLHAKSKGSRM